MNDDLQTQVNEKYSIWIARTIDIAKYAVKSDNFQKATITQGIYGSLFNMSIEYISL